MTYQRAFTNASRRFSLDSSESMFVQRKWMTSPSWTVRRPSPPPDTGGSLRPHHSQKQQLNRGGRCLYTASTTDAIPDYSKRVGFIGLGNMGLPMALNLHWDDVHVVAFDVVPTACEAAVRQGVTVASRASELLTEHRCGMIVTMLPGCQAVHATMTELWNDAPNDESLVVVDCSTVSPSTSRHWHEQWSQKGHVMLDAPVSGGVKGATDGTLTFMVGCHQAQDLDKARPYLQLMGQRVVACGNPGTGSATKLCNNLALAAQMIGVCEAMNLGEALGVDPVVLADVMNQSTAKCWSSEVNNPHPMVATAKSTNGVGPPASRDYEGGFATKLMLKDLGLAVAAADEANVAMPLTASSKELYRLVHAHGLGTKDFGVMLKFLKGSGPK